MAKTTEKLISRDDDEGNEGTQEQIDSSTSQIEEEQEESYVAIHLKQPFQILMRGEDGNMYQVDPIHIPDNAYQYRSNVTELHFPITESVGNGAFKMCTTVTELYIPKLKYAGEFAFHGCLVMEKIDTPELETVCNGAFQACASANPINIPKATLIGDNSFQDCMAVEDMCIPNVKSIGDFSFRWCDNLTSFRALNLQIMGQGAFEGCLSLAGIFVPGVYEIKDETFKECENLRYVSFPVADTIYKDTFKDCHSMVYLNLPSILVGQLPSESLTGMDNLRWLNIKREVTTGMVTDAYLEDLGLDPKKSKVSVICKDGIKIFNQGEDEKHPRMLYDQSGWIIGIKPPEGPDIIVKSLSKREDGSEDESEDISEDEEPLESNLDDFYANGIQPSVFQNRKELKSVVMPNLTEHISSYTFMGCSELAFAAFPRLNLPNIGKNAFKDCPKLRNLSLIGMTREVVWNSGGSWGLTSGCVVECSNGYVVIP